MRSPVKKMLSYKELNNHNQSFTGINSYNTINNNSFNNNNNLQNNFKVYCRFRPINELEISRTNNKSCVEVTSKKDLLIIADTCLAIKQNYSFDQVFDEDSTGEDIYNITTKNLVIDVLKGYNCTLMCYGQTSSGKTYTINQISPLVFKEIFEFKNKNFSSNNNSESNYFKVSISYLEIYMEKVNDLINTENQNLNIFENKKKEIIIEGMTIIECDNVNQLLEIQKNAEKNRRINSTLMNQYSSRSHCIMIITVHFQDKDKNELKVGKLYLVDLAGSEKTSKTGASGLNLEEAKNINKSLHCLGLIIKTLSDLHSNNNNNNNNYFNNSLNNYNNNNTISHIPYRNSKLTRILSDSLGGNSKTTLILTCSKSEYNQSETISTLRFGERAKKIKTKPKINVELKSESKEELLKQIERMKKELNEQNEKIEYMKNFNYQNTLESNNNLNSSRDTLIYEDIINQLKEEIANLKKRLEIYQNNNNNSFNNSENDEKLISLKQNKKKSKFNNLENNSNTFDSNNSINNNNKEIEKLKSLLQEKEKYIEELLSNISLLEKDKKNSEEKINNLLSEINYLKEEITKLEENSNLYKKNKLLDSNKINDLNNNINKLKEENLKIINIYKSIKNDYENIKNQNIKFNNDNNLLEENIKNLNEKINNYENKNNINENKISVLNQKIKELLHNIDTINNDNKLKKEIIDEKNLKIKKINF
jgi:kinesin family protein 5